MSEYERPIQRFPLQVLFVFFPKIFFLHIAKRFCPKLFSFAISSQFLPNISSPPHICTFPNLVRGIVQGLWLRRGLANLMISCDNVDDEDDDDEEEEDNDVNYR